MTEANSRRTVAIAVAGIIVLLVAVIAGREIIGGANPGAGGPSGVMAGKAGGPPGRPGGGPGGPGGGPAAPVSVAVIAEAVFSDGIQALGTAQAWESIVITPSVTDTISTIRFDSGDRVARGQVLATLDAAEENGALAEAQAAQAEAEREQARFEELHARGFVPNARLEEAQAATERAAARAQSARARMADRVIRAPFAGVIGLRAASVGALVRPGDTIATLDDLSRIKLDFDVSEAYLARLFPGVAVAARSAAYPDAVFEGVIDTVDSRVNQNTRNVRVRAVLDNRDQRLRAGMLLTVEVRANPRRALAVPEIAVLDQAAGPAVYRVLEREGAALAELAPIRTGQRIAGMVEVLAGLDAGDRVVADGVNRVRPGQAVRVTPPPASASDSVAPTSLPRPSRS